MASLDGRDQSLSLMPSRCFTRTWRPQPVSPADLATFWRDAAPPIPEAAGKRSAMTYVTAQPRAHVLADLRAASRLELDHARHDKFELVRLLLKLAEGAAASDRTGREVVDVAGACKPALSRNLTLRCPVLASRYANRRSQSDDLFPHAEVARMLIRGPEVGSDASVTEAPTCFSESVTSTYVAVRGRDPFVTAH